jgi:hypothetical protein
MPYESIDKLQNLLGEKVFHYTKDKKKAAGRALGTLVEIITFYFLKAWELEGSLAIEKRLYEYGSSEISHNVEYSLHPLLGTHSLTSVSDGSSITANKVCKELSFSWDNYNLKNNNILDKHDVLRNACTILENENSYVIGNLKASNSQEHEITLSHLHKKPYAVFECKRVGVEEGMKKGPQTIEKAKQGAYVARTASALQKIRTDKGEAYGVIYREDNTPYIKPYNDLLEEIIYTGDGRLLQKFILTVGVVSNHGNWFTAQNQNKELKVLSSAYDWLLFLTDAGLATFIEELLLSPSSSYKGVQKAFQVSYSATKKRNVFTKVRMDREAHFLLTHYFQEHLPRIEGWFNVITPENRSLHILREELITLQQKNWASILKQD